MNAPRRTSLVARPDREVTSDYDERLDVRGRWGSGLFLLASRTLRLPLGYDWAGDGTSWEPHLRSRALVTGHKALPWMHMGYVPHVLLARDDDRVDLVAILGTFGERKAFGDGCEANFPGYGILRTEPRKRAHELWEDGVALEIELHWQRDGIEHSEIVGETGELTFHLEPGRLALTPRTAGHPWRALVFTVNDDEPETARITVQPNQGVASALDVVLRFRVLAKRLTTPPVDFASPIDTLRSPYGFSNFEDHELVPRRTEHGARFACPALQRDVRFEFEEARSTHCTLAAVDPLDPTFHTGTTTDGVRAARAFDVQIHTQTHTSRGIVFRLGTCNPDARPIAASTRSVPIEGPSPLRVATGDPAIDGYVRWAIDTARTLIWPNDLITTGSLGYLGKSHVGQDVPFVFPSFLIADHPGFHRAARRTLSYVLDGPRSPDEIGIADHPCDAFDFAFAPYDPRHARYWKRFGATGILRWMQCLTRFVEQLGPVPETARHVDVLRTVYREHYLPFDPRRAVWGAGEETQDRLYAAGTAPRALREFARLLTLTGHEPDAEAFIEDAERIRAWVNRPTSEGGAWLDRDLVSNDGLRLPSGLLVTPDRCDPSSRFFSFDVPLVNAVAILGEALTDEHRAQVLERFLADDCPWFVPERGYAKKSDGSRGVWYWHQSLLAEAFLRHADEHPHAAQRAMELFGFMGRAAVDVNGIAIPGEELNGGDYAMGIGCLGVSALLDGVLQPDFTGDEPRFAQAVWPGTTFSVSNYSFRGRHVDA
ncbi:MAG: hypothetical protein H6834_05245 [Planctomycetes bacterium]|nr:hypothetical protein [Planctomycetota bacterium]